MKFKSPTFFAFTFIAFMQGCATPPPVIIDQALVAEAATKTLQEAVYYSTIFSSCAALGGEAEIDAISTQYDWLSANTNLILAADEIYSRQQAANTFDYQGKTLAPAAIKLALDSKLRAINELKLDQRTPLNKIKACQYRLGKITGTAFQLGQIPEIAPYVDEILKHPPLDATISETPKLAAGITEVAPGPTYYQLVKSHEAKCPNGFTLSVINQWPKEVYANFCGNSSVEILTCDWGKCEAKKL